jgi:hypothetical protein
VDRAIEITRSGSAYATTWALRVEGLVKGPQMSQLTVSQTGSPDAPGSDLQGDPLFRPGESYLLFLREGAQFTYFGPYGRYLVSDGKVYSMNYVVDDGGYRAPAGLDFAGADVNSVVSDIAVLRDSVQMVFTQGQGRLPADVLGYPAGSAVSVDVRLSSGEHGPGGVTLKIDRSGLPAGLDVTLEPAVFVAFPRSVNASNVTVTIGPNVQAGTYRIPVEYVFEGVGQGSRVITLNVDAR